MQKITQKQQKVIIITLFLPIFEAVTNIELENGSGGFEITSEFYNHLENEIKSKLISPADNINEFHDPSPETISKFRQLAALNNSPRNVYSSNSHFP